MESLIKEYKKQFGHEPIIIGIYWDNTEALTTNIIDAIDNNKPYNERDLLSKEELKAFDNGDLLF